MNQPFLHIGLTHVIQKKITLEDTALNYGSGQIEYLLATPKLIALMVEACAQSLDPLLPEGYVSVCHHVEIDHFKPTLQGSTVTVESKVLEFDEGQCVFELTAYDDFGPISSGIQKRSVVNHASLMNRAYLRERLAVS